jgi:hypothetical protein
VRAAQNFREGQLFWTSTDLAAKLLDFQHYSEKGYLIPTNVFCRMRPAPLVNGSRPKGQVLYAKPQQPAGLWEVRPVHQHGIRSNSQIFWREECVNY